MINLEISYKHKLIFKSNQIGKNTNNIFVHYCQNHSYIIASGQCAGSVLRPSESFQNSYIISHFHNEDMLVQFLDQ